MNRLKVFKSKFLYSSTFMTELSLCLAFFLCAAVLIKNQNLFSGSIAYMPIEWIPEYIAGIFFALLGTVKFGGMWYESDNIRKVVCYIGSAVWTYLALRFFFSDVYGLVNVLFVLCAIMQLFVLLRISVTEKRIIADDNE